MHPALDGMRAVFVLSVIAYHLWSTNEHWSLDTGSIGVVGFFALSGYLITGLVIGEHETSGRVRLTYFYARRALGSSPPSSCFSSFGCWSFSCSNRANS